MPDAGKKAKPQVMAEAYWLAGIGGFVDAFVSGVEVGFIDRFETDEDPTSAAGRDQIEKFFVTQ